MGASELSFEAVLQQMWLDAEAGGLGALTAHRAAPAWGAWEQDLDDGRVVHAPVGSFRPSGFGLHDTIGNVWEWCRDGKTPYSKLPRPGDGLREAQTSRYRIIRGGAFFSVGPAARSAYRDYHSPNSRIDSLGCRPSRRVER